MTTEEKLIRDYVRNSEVCMGEYLASVSVPRGMTYERAFEVYVECMKQANGDRFIVIKEGERIEL